MKTDVGLLFLCIVIVLLTGSLFLKAQEVTHHDNVVDAGDPHACLTCHDGSIATNISPCTKASCILDANSSHPVFKPYPPQDKRDEFHTLSEVVSAGLRLFNGEVTCISCHNLANQQEFHLIMENRRSQLCKICHIR